MRKMPWIVAAVGIALFVAPALAGPPAEPVGPEVLAAIFAQAPGQCAASTVGPAEGPGDSGTDADCTARCQDGSTRTCTGTSCQARDYSCSAGQRGYCWSNWEGYKYCPMPTCPTSPCYAQTQCSNGSTVSCTGYNQDCFSVPNCYAHCDGQYYLCPSTPSNCPW